MEKHFWLDHWIRDDIAFHQRQVDPLLEKYWTFLKLPKGSRVLVPLCGKSLADIMQLN